MSGRSWCKQGIRYRTRQEYQIIEALRVKYPVKFLCEIMCVSKSGYYRWRGRQGTLNRYEQDRQLLTKLLEQEHEKHSLTSVWQQLRTFLNCLTTMFITIITSGLRLLWGTKAQFSTRPNWASKAMVFFGVYFSLTDAQDVAMQVLFYALFAY